MRHLLASLFAMLCIGCEPSDADSCSDTGVILCPDGRGAYCVPVGYDGPLQDCVLDTGRDDCPPEGIPTVSSCALEGGEYVVMCADPDRMPACE